MCRLTLLLFILFFLLTACSNTLTVDEEVVASSPTNPKVSQQAVSTDNKKISPGDPKFSPIRRSLVENIQLPSGSLFNSHRAVGLYSPSSHYQVGDMILVEVKENTSANKSVKYQKDKSGHFELKPVTLNAGSIKIGNNDLNAEYEQGKEFDSSYKRNQPATFPVNGVISGWTEALQLMKEGDKWQLFIPSDLAYGTPGSGPDIGPNEVLIFDIELLKVN